MVLANRKMRQLGKVVVRSDQLELIKKIKLGDESMSSTLQSDQVVQVLELSVNDALNTGWELPCLSVLRSCPSSKSRILTPPRRMFYFLNTSSTFLFPFELGKKKPLEDLLWVT